MSALGVARGLFYVAQAAGDIDGALIYPAWLMEPTDEGNRIAPIASRVLICP
jgi:hypothetical protein